ncbi:hypothetical protein BHE74_00000846 [Ensete ventricosum]|nr:hypothetical protein GW17_00034886 [Ensete ventricosum]RWW90017.1 hypothetical protein BHE74_00000846 [Ensete ventricosum]RZR78555.1 hypothetical protein BHM03_00003970 [Ensete ventricosum]
MFALCCPIPPPFEFFTDAHIIDEGVTLGRHAVARFLIVGIATMRPWSVCSCFLASKCELFGLYCFHVERRHRHELPRQEVRQVICVLCGTEQEASS